MNFVACLALPSVLIPRLSIAIVIPSTCGSQSLSIRHRVTCIEKRGSTSSQSEAGIFFPAFLFYSCLRHHQAPRSHLPKSGVVISSIQIDQRIKDKLVTNINATCLLWPLGTQRPIVVIKSRNPSQYMPHHKNIPSG